jgi:predicted nucleic acid-binding protein
MRVVLDTNVVVSGVIKEEGPHPVKSSLASFKRDNSFL